MKRAAFALILAIACLAQTSGPAVSAYLLRAGSSTYQQGDYRWLRIDPPLQLTWDAQGAPHLGLIPSGPVELPAFDPPLTTTVDIANRLHVGLPQQTIAITQAPVQDPPSSNYFVMTGTRGPLAARPLTCDNHQLYFTTPPDPPAVFHCVGEPGVWQ